ncbi:hypothetical protein [Fundidesulfovibrio agrisoli]|uniref:hypothetical protein n=1 Tax=Fundidesulfovibrio agrisoli TaxID=2922717 RepID=UPI001FAC6E8A|nr:hypothetical protein [Fundidesulfovibrio agrisoli]
MENTKVRSKAACEFADNARVYNAIAEESIDHMRMLLDDVIIMKNLQKCIETRMECMTSRCVQAIDMMNMLSSELRNVSMGNEEIGE